MNNYNIKTLLLAIVSILIQLVLYVFVINMNITNEYLRILLGIVYVLVFVLPGFYVFVNILESARENYGIKESWIRLIDDVNYLIETMNISYFVYKINSAMIWFGFLLLLYMMIILMIR